MPKPIEYIDSIPTFTYPWSRVRDTYRDFVTGKATPKGTVIREHIPQWKMGSSFFGATSEEMLSHLANGYELPDMANIPAPVSMAPEQDWRWNDQEGEYDHDLFTSGEPEYYLDAPIIDTPLGIRLQVGLGFNASTGAQLIAEYAQWIGSVIKSLEKQGFTLEIAMQYEGQHRYNRRKNENVGGRCNHRVIVSEFGQVNLATDWSALFAPGSYRHLGWLVYGLPTEDGQATLAHGLGGSTPSGFEVTFDTTTRTLTTRTDSRATRFDHDSMNRQLAEALKSA